VVNTVVIIGKVADLTVTFDADGKPQTSFTLRYEQEYGEGKTAKLFVPVDAAPSRAESMPRPSATAIACLSMACLIGRQRELMRRLQRTW
jgi:hypothetical protein